MNYKGEPIEFVESSKVKEGVFCEVYKFSNTSEKDLGKVFVQAGQKTPFQKVLKGDKTHEVYSEGEGKLMVVQADGEKREYSFPEHKDEVEISVGEYMQWLAITDLIFYEVCWPPYEEGRFETIDEG